MKTWICRAMGYLFSFALVIAGIVMLMSVSSISRFASGQSPLPCNPESPCPSGMICCGGLCYNPSEQCCCQDVPTSEACGMMDPDA